MTFNLDTIIFFVKDVEKLRLFYTEVFGFLVLEEYPSEWVLLKAGDCRIGLHQTGKQWLSEQQDATKFHNNTKIVFEIDDDIYQLRQTLSDQKVAMREVSSFDGFLFCDGEDPEGNVFQLRQKVDHIRS